MIYKGPFSDMVRNEAIRSTFVRTSVEFLLKNKFDGLGNLKKHKLNLFIFKFFK